jgi:two-component system chemotaxis response regulator CheY
MDTSHSVLVVDDSQVTLQIVTKLLQGCGFQNISHADSGANALRMMREKQYRLVFSDVNMADMHGVELLRAVRSDARLSDSCFVLMTTMRHRDVIEAALRYQADAIIMKPFTSEVLKCKLADLEKLKARAN